MSGLVNRLSKCSSPYLKQHADNPVHWQPWDSDAFASAKRLSRPIFVSIGYSTCHWCHVMARDSFQSHDLAKMLNEHFVCIKVDREERPDVDRQYMMYVQASSGSGGWPLSVWCTPSGRPFFGCTFLWEGQMKKLCEAIAKQWAEKKEAIEETAERGQALIQALSKPAAGNFELDQSLVHDLYKHYEAANDADFGGFGGAPKFPNVVILHFLVDYYRIHRTVEALKMAQHTASVIIKSGLHDHLEGGFHRYCVDSEWKTPHFEKMLYDQGQLLEIFSELYLLSDESLRIELQSGIESIVMYTTEQLQSPSGAYFCAEDADSLNSSGDKEEGAFAVWTLQELQEIIPKEDLDLVVETFNICSEGNATQLPGMNVLTKLFAQKDLCSKYLNYFSRLENCKKLMAERRKTRARPHRDEKTLTSWNGLMISGLARAGFGLDRKEYISKATRALDALTKSTPLMRTGKMPACADDYAFMIKAAIDLYQSTLDDVFLEKAITLQQGMEDFFAHPQGAYYYNQLDPDGIVTRAVDDYDGAEPCANSIASLNLLRLSLITGEANYGERLTKVMESFSRPLRESPVALPLMWRTSCINKACPIVISLPSLTSEIGNVLRKHSDKIIILKRDRSLSYIQICKGTVCYEPCEAACDLDKSLLQISNK